MALTQPPPTTETVGQSVEAQGLTYVDVNNNPVTGLNIAGLVVTIGDPTIVSASYDSTNLAWKFTGLAAGATAITLTDPATGLKCSTGVTVTPAAGQPAGILFTSWSTPA